jgi:hypothetical protein
MINKLRSILLIVLTAIFLASCNYNSGEMAHAQKFKPKQVSGIYPHLAMFNDESECGTGAVVPWADRLWAITICAYIYTYRRT